MTQEEFDQLTAGLLYMSEPDAPLTYFEMSLEESEHWPPATAAQFLELIDEEPSTPVEELDPEIFFEKLRLGNEDREDQIGALKNAFAEWESLRGFRVGDIQIKIFVSGKDASSERVIGLQTLSVET